ncbi:MAG: hypothetical protein JSV42_12815 [Chloroflexota bacterium]|nr:MAG: hypothetical protein JSV42_12815 [Chloroflexota bacterium]
MDTKRSHLIKRPYTFDRGNTYLYRDRDLNGKRGNPQLVKFAAYDPCPAFVIICLKDGKRLRCLRENLYEVTGVNPNQNGNKWTQIISSRHHTV